MTRFPLQRDQNPWWMFVPSLFFHLLIFYFCTHSALFNFPGRESTPYYVDLVSLPDLDPAPGTPETKPSVPAPVQQPAPPIVQKPLMTLPGKVTAKTSIPPASQPLTNKEQEAQEFADRLNRLERTADAKHQAAAIESMQRKAADVSRTASMPGATGIKPGSDYGAYIQSRLKDVLTTTLVYQSKKPETSVHLYIDAKGKLIRYVIKKSSRDKLFDDSVIRTIETAKSTFPPTPGGAPFDKLYVFSPDEVIKK